MNQEIKWTPGAFEVRYQGRRYWAHLRVHLGGCIWTFWSDHPWPFYHGHFTQRMLDKREAMRRFMKWLPFFDKLVADAGDTPVTY